MYLTRRFYIAAFAVILVVASGYVLSPMYTIGQGLAYALGGLTVADILLLWWKKAVTASRQCADRFSNGDENVVQVHVQSTYPVPVRLEVVDEIPFVFQRRDVSFASQAKARGTATVTYRLTPTKRGEYGFGRIRVFVSTWLGLVQRRYTCGSEQTVKVYPSFLMLRKYELMAMSNELREQGTKRVRRIGHNTDFEQIKDYVVGDDFRTINWKATARRAPLGSKQPRLMVNQYQEERSQQFFSVIDKGRMMQQSFQGMTLLDDAINAALVMSYVAMAKGDRAGLVTFCDQMGTFLPASRQPHHLQALQEALYSEQTAFGESDFPALAMQLGRRINKRSLLVLYTSFVGLNSLNRQLPSLRQLSQRHRLLVVFFQDEELEDFVGAKPGDAEDYYQHVIADKFICEQRLIVQTLRQHGIQTLLTTPGRLTIDVVNKYLEMRHRF